MFILSVGLVLALEIGDTNSFVPKNLDDDIELVSANADTLTFVTCGDHMFDPFGPMKSVSDIHQTELKQFHLDTLRRDEYTFYKLTYSASYFILFLDFEGGERPAYVMKGELVDSVITIQPGLRVGMSRSEFFAAFFKEIPRSWSNATTVVFESCVVGERQTYTFKKNKLSKVFVHCFDCIPEFQF